MAEVWGSWVKTNTLIGATWSGILSLLSINTMARPTASASTVGCSAVMGYHTYAHCGDGSVADDIDEWTDASGYPVTQTWSQELQAALLEFIAYIPEGLAPFNDVDCFVYAATASAGSNSETKYLATGNYRTDYSDFGRTWVGPDEWILPFTFSVTNCRLNYRTGHVEQNNRVSPRRWTDRKAGFSIRADGDTGVAATLGDLSASDTYDLRATPPDPEIDMGYLSELVCGISYMEAPEANTSYASITGLAVTGENIALNTVCHLWSTLANADRESFYAGWEAPEGAIWHYFSEGGGFTMHRIAAGSSAVCLSETGVTGPVRWNVMAGRFARGSGFGAPDNFEVDVGLRRYIDETETETIYLPEGLSGWYCQSQTARWLYGAFSTLRTGMITLPVNGYALVREEWLETNGELLESGAINNRSAACLLPSIQADPATEEPWWGPLVAVTHSDISVDIPPGETARPSSWAAVDGTGLSVDGADNGLWECQGAGGQVTRDLLSRYFLRLDYLNAGLSEGDNYDTEWPIQKTANGNQANDIQAWADAVPVEDVFNYDNSRILQVLFSQYPTAVDWTGAKLELQYSHPNISDPCTTCFEHRVGPEGSWSYSREDHTTEFLPDLEQSADGTLIFDLGQLARSASIHLQHVRKVTLTLPQAGTYRLSDVRLVRDPSNHEATTYPEFSFHQAVDPWNWQSCKCGFGANFEGMPVLNIANGTEGIFGGDVERGIWQTQYIQHCPESELTDDPTAPVSLSRVVQVINYQEQLTATYDTATQDGGIKDADENTLGVIYPWDMNRATGHDTDGKVAIKYGTSHAWGFGTVFIPTTVNVEWTTHGRAQGIGVKDGVIVRGAGGSYDGNGGRVKIYRRATEEGGLDWKWELCGSGNPDITGRWLSPPALEPGYLYGTKAAALDAEPTNTTNFVTRQCADLSAYIPAAFRDTHMCREWPLGNVWLIAENGEGNCLVYYIDANVPVECKTHPFTTGVYRRPSIAVCSWGWIYACATNTQTGNMEIAVSKKGGDTWEAPVATLGSGLQYGTIWHHRGSIRLCGWADDKVYLASASAADLVRETLDGTNELIEVAAYTVTDDAIPVTSVVVREDGEDLVAVGDASGTAIYGSRNYREGFNLYS